MTQPLSLFLRGLFGPEQGEVTGCGLRRLATLVFGASKLSWAMTGDRRMRHIAPGAALRHLPLGKHIAVARDRLPKTLSNPNALLVIQWLKREADTQADHRTCPAISACGRTWRALSDGSAGPGRYCSSSTGERNL